MLIVTFSSTMRNCLTSYLIHWCLTLPLIYINCPTFCLQGLSYMTVFIIHLSNLLFTMTVTFCIQWLLFFVYNDCYLLFTMTLFGRASSSDNVCSDRFTSVLMSPSACVFRRPTNFPISTRLNTEGFYTPNNKQLCG